MKTSPNLVWIDLEMTGLNPNKDKVLELAVLVTDSNLKIIDEGFDVVIHQSKYVINRMNAWSREQHQKSGLAEACLKSKINIGEVKNKLLRLVKKYCEPHTGVLCGISVYVDRKFLLKYFPKVEKYLHHRLIDITTLRELSWRWYKNDVLEFQEKKEEEVSHRAMEDIKYSIKELEFYRRTIFKAP